MLAKWETITLHVAFNPELVAASEWHHYYTRHEHVWLGGFRLSEKWKSTKGLQKTEPVEEMQVAQITVYIYTIKEKKYSEKKYMIHLICKPFFLNGTAPS